MGSLTLQEFQEQVADLLLRHRSVLDIMSKYQQTNAAVNRTVTKSITECGCIIVNASKQPYAEQVTMESAKEAMNTHIDGQLCEHCQDIVKTEIGKNVFYLSALANILNLNLDEIIAEESKRCSTLGLYKFS